MMLPLNRTNQIDKYAMTTPKKKPAKGREKMFLSGMEALLGWEVQNRATSMDLVKLVPKEYLSPNCNNFRTKPTATQA